VGSVTLYNLQNYTAGKAGSGTKVRRKIQWMAVYEQRAVGSLKPQAFSFFDFSPSP
jgi:hypothetical protein